MRIQLWPFALLGCILAPWAIGVTLVLLTFSGCAGNGTIDPIKAASAQVSIAALCDTAMGLSPLAGPYAPFIIGGCAGEAAIAQLALNPTSEEWLNGIILKVHSLSH